VDNIIQDFIWNGGTSKLSKSTLTQNIDNGGLKMCNFQFKIKALQLSWIKRLTNSTDSTWKTLPQHFYKCKDLLIYFNANHETLHKNKIPSFYTDIHKEYMKHFKQTPNNTTDILEQSLWLNNHITIQHKPIYWKNWILNGIMTISNILDHENKFLSHTELNMTYKLKSTYLQVEQIKSSIPNIWKKELKGTHNIENKNNQTLKIHINNQYKNIQFVKCKEFYWHLININIHIPTSKQKWAKIYSSLKDPEENVWKNIYDMHFKTIHYRV